MILRLAVKELLKKWKWSLVFIINLSFGLIGFTSIMAYQKAIENNLTSNAKQILSADLSISARRRLTTTEINKAESFLTENKIMFVKTEAMDFFAMLNFKGKTQLVLVKAIENSYPLYGQIELETKLITNQSDKEILKSNSLWIYNDIKNNLNLNIGDTVTLGDLTLTVADFVKNESTQTFRMAGFAPKVFINRKLLEKSNLLKFGSTFSSLHLYRFYSEPKPNIQKELFKILSDPGIQIDTPETASEDSSRQMSFLTEFLNLVSLIALLLAGMGSSYLFQVFSKSKTTDFAIFKILGLSYSQIRNIYLIQILVLCISVCIVTLAGSHLFVPFLQFFLNPLISTSFKVTIPTTVTTITFGLTLFSSLLVVWPFLKISSSIPANTLFKDEFTSLYPSSNQIWIFIMALFGLSFLSFFVSKSWYISVVFLSLVAISITLFFIIGRALIYFSERIIFNHWTIHYSIRSLNRKKATSIVLFITLGTSVMLLNILPQLKSSLESEFLTDKNHNLPSIFLFDIQDEQIPTLKKIALNLGKELNQLSPLIRSRLISINGKPYERKVDDSILRTREEERDARFRNRGINLTFRDHLSSSETIVEGVDLATYHGDIPGLSIEKKYSERMGIKLGDVLSFDIQGVDVTGKVINFRKVKWSSLQPNFFISFAPGILNDAPKTFISIVNNLTDDEIKHFINLVHSELPNVSVIDVRHLLKNVLSISEQLTLSLKLMAYLSLLTGLIILASIILTQLQERKWEINLLKIFGTNRSSIRKYLFYEFGTIVGLAILIGSITGLFLSYLLIKFVFESDFAPNFKESFLIGFYILAFAILLILILTKSYINRKPKDLLISI